jgi:GT2 family glycosyltransferase
MIQKLLFKLRSSFLSPDGKLELWLRTLYHKINKSQLSFIVQKYLSIISYWRWKTWQKGRQDQGTIVSGPTPKVIFLISHETGDNTRLAKTLLSIMDLEVSCWEVMIFDKNNDFQKNFPPKIIDNPKFKFVFSKSISEIDFSEGDFVIFCQPGDVFLKGFLNDFYRSFSQEGIADWYYFDCEYSENDKHAVKPLFKPALLSPELLLSHNYLTRGLIRRTFFVDYLDDISALHETLSQEYHLALKVCENRNTTEHIPFLSHQQANLVLPNTPERQAVITAHLERLGLTDIKIESRLSGYRFSWAVTKPSVAIIIPTKNNHQLLAPLIHSIINKTHYQNFSIHIMDNRSDLVETKAYYNQIAAHPNINIHEYDAEFNYSQVNNLGAAESNSDLILLLNDDMEIIDPDWLEELVQWATRPEIGVVGAKLIRANHIIQHAGIVVGLNGFVGHIYLNTPEDYHGLFGSVDWYRNYLAVTGACQMFRREVFNEVNGYDEGYKIAFGDVDFCLRVHDLGYRIVYTPYANIYHFEGRSRGYSTPRQDVLHSYAQMEEILYQEDPYFSPNLTYTRIPKCVNKTRELEEIKNLVELRKKMYLKNNTK